MAQITEDYVSFEIAKLLKEKGFVISYDSFRGVYINGEFLRRNPGQAYLHNTGDEIIEVCSIQMAMKWLREVHNLHIQPEITAWPRKGYFIKIYLYKNCHNNFEKVTFVEHKETYEEACDAAIKYCLKNLV